MGQCIDCLENCDKIVSDKCVVYTGNSSSLLGLCSGESTLFEFETAVEVLLTTLVDGSGITPANIIMGCAFTSGFLGTNPPTLTNLLNTLFQGECALNTEVQLLIQQVNPSYSFNLSCLTGMPAVPTRDDILQAAILQTCNNTAGLAAVVADYVKASELCPLVIQCLANTPPVAQYSAIMVPYAPIPYIGPLSNFDNTGKGIVAAGFQNVYLMNGLNGTQDWRGRSPIGAIQNVPGGTLDPAVDPSLPQNAGANYALNQKAGLSVNTLTVNQLPPHTHGLTDPGHIHTGAKPVNSYGNGGNGNAFTSTPFTTTNIFTSPSAVTGITIASTGGGLPIDNRQPSIACYYIIFIPA